MLIGPYPAMRLESLFQKSEQQRTTKSRGNRVLEWYLLTSRVKAASLSVYFRLDRVEQQLHQRNLSRKPSKAAVAVASATLRLG